MDYLKRLLSNFALKHLLKAPIREQVLEIKNGKVFLGGLPAPEVTVNALIADAKFWKRSTLNTILLETLKSKAQESMFNKSQSVQDMLSGKLFLYAIDTQDKLVDFLTKM